MNSDIWPATIGAFALILSTVLVVWKEEIRNRFVRAERGWSGFWAGSGKSDPTDTEYKITVKLTQRGRVVSGTLTTHEPEELEYEIEGRIQENEFMTYYAKNAAKNVVNYVVGINQLARDGKRMTGTYVARSRLVEGISTGTIDLRPVDTL